MPADPYTVLRALLQAEALRSAHNSESERTSDRPHASDTDEQPRQDPNHT